MKLLKVISGFLDLALISYTHSYHHAFNYEVMSLMFCFYSSWTKAEHSREEDRRHSDEQEPDLTT
jgi:hypothetical protein